jgi:hypothetical protein
MNGESMMHTDFAVMSNASAGRATARPIVASASAEGFHLPSKPSSWEMLLDSIGIPEATCTSLIGCRSQKGRAIRSWVFEHYKTNFVPESVLEFLDLRYELKLKWQVED